MHHRKSSRSPDIAQFALEQWGSLEVNTGALSFFDRFDARPDARVPRFEYRMGGPRLRELRNKYRLHAVAGNGDELSRALNLSRWLCEGVPPGGAVGVPNESLELLAHAYGSRKGGEHGLHCGQFAVVYSEALLSVGILSRVVVLEGFNPNVPGCHWVAIAWIGTPGRWVMIDAMYHSYYCDEAGTILSPWEIRDRLVNRQSLRLNDDWGSRTHPWGWTSAMLLQFYAKNLCYMGSPVRTGYGCIDARDNQMVWLVPKGFDVVYRDLKLARYYAMRERNVIDFRVTPQQYREARGRLLHNSELIRSGHLFTSSLASFRATPEAHEAAKRR